MQLVKSGGSNANLHLNFSEYRQGKPPLRPIKLMPCANEGNGWPPKLSREKNREPINRQGKK